MKFKTVGGKLYVIFPARGGPSSRLATETECLLVGKMTSALRMLGDIILDLDRLNKDDIGVRVGVAAQKLDPER